MDAPARHKGLESIQFGPSPYLVERLLCGEGRFAKRFGSTAQCGSGHWEGSLRGRQTLAPPLNWKAGPATLLACQIGTLLPYEGQQCREGCKLETVHCKSLEALEAAIGLSGPDALFRGQTKHFERADGSPSLTTTFSRHGCIPDLMVKWHHYACKILKRYVQGRTDTPDLATDQAVLQHYGWRSFFLDTTGDAKVAAWFASNEYKSHKVVNLVEDCFESPVSLISEMASFEKTQGIGHLYVISRKMIRHAHIGAVHLSEIATNTGSPRYVRQDAYMVGPVDPVGLALECISYHITAPSDVLAAYAQDLTMETLFPSPNDDPILSELLAMPWEQINQGIGGIGFFRRSLPLPEYNQSILKHMPPSAAMYRPFWLKDVPQDPNDSVILSHVLCSARLYHGSSALTFELPHLTELLLVCDGVLVETQGLIYHGMGSLYGKGVIVMKKGNGLVHVSELGVKHPGLQLQEFGKFPGVHFRVDESGTWHRAKHSEDCDCGDDHHDHIHVLGRVEAGLSDGSIIKLNERVYAEQGVDPCSDASALHREDPSHEH